MITVGWMPPRLVREVALRNRFPLAFICLDAWALERNRKQDHTVS